MTAYNKKLPLPISDTQQEMRKIYLHYPQRDDGYSLLDILAAIMVVSIVLGISTLDISSLVKKQTLKPQISRLKAAMESLSLVSIQQKTHATLVITSKGYTQLWGEDPTAQLQRYRFPKNITANLSKPEKTIYFYKTGVNTPATVELKFHELTCKVILSLRGRIRDTCN